MTNGSSGNVSPENPASSEVDPSRSAPATPPPAHADTGDSDEVLRAIGELQSGLGGLRALQEQTVKLGEELARKRAAIATEHARLAALKEEVAAEKAAANKAREDLEAGRAELESRRTEIDLAAEKLLALRDEIEAGRAEIAAAREELARETARIEALSRTLEARAAQESSEASAAAAESQARISELDREVSRLQEQLEEETREFSAKLTDAAAAKAALEARVASLESDLEEARSAASAADRAEGTGADDGELSALRDQLALVEQARSELEDQLAANAGLAADAMSWNARRRERLRRYKALLQMQARKIVTAKEALEKRQAECEQLLSQRTKLQAALERVREAEKAAASSSARTGAALTVFCAFATLALIMVMSWAVTNHVVPATYIASAVIAPDGRGVSLADADIESWQRYHEGLARDPGMMEEAAGRFRQRGIISLGSAPELSARLSNDLAVQSRTDGSLILELRGKGAEKTARELDTFVTALASVANAARTNRPDGAATEIAQPAKVGREPVEDPRLVYAGGIAGGGALAATLLGLVVWGRMVRAKRRYEEEQALSNTLEELTWAAPGETAAR